MRKSYDDYNGCFDDCLTDVVSGLGSLFHILVIIVLFIVGWFVLYENFSLWKAGHSKYDESKFESIGFWSILYILYGVLGAVCMVVPFLLIYKLFGGATSGALMFKLSLIPLCLNYAFVWTSKSWLGIK
jgi:hypothetical protein